MRPTSTRILLAAAALAGACNDAPVPPVPAAGTPAPAAAAPPAAAAAGIRFEECAESRGLAFRMKFLPAEQGENFKINLYDHGSGVTVCDFDGDGRDDVLLLNQLGPSALFRNAGGGRFAEVTKDAGEFAASLDGKICVAAAFADADGDGDGDLYVTTTRGGNVFLVNDGRGRFTDATKDAGLVLVTESETPCFFDADADGDLDLFVTNTARWTLDEYDAAQRYYRGKRTLADLIVSEKLPNAFYVNDGKGRFTDATAESGLRGKGWGGDVAVFDMDGDGDLDLFVGNMFGASTLFRNEGGGRFADATREALGVLSWGAVGARAFDYDGDGRLDLFVADMHSDMWMSFTAKPEIVEETKKYRSFMQRVVEMGLVPASVDEQFARDVDIRPGEVVFGSTLYRSLGGGKFEETSDRARVETLWPWGVADGDFDSDGFVDAFIPTGMGYPFFYWRSPLLRNRGDGTFEDVCREAGTEPPPGGTESGEKIGGVRCTRSARCATTLDFDEDGRLDLVVNNFNDRAFLWRNVSQARHWCELRLVATRGQRDAIGALVRLTAGGRTHVRQVQAVGGYLSQSSNVLHFGLGDAGTITSIDIRWPSGTTQRVKAPRIDARTTVTEPAK